MPGGRGLTVEFFSISKQALVCNREYFHLWGGGGAREWEFQTYHHGNDADIGHLLSSCPESRVCIIVLCKSHHLSAVATFARVDMALLQERRSFIRFIISLLLALPSSPVSLFPLIFISFLIRMMLLMLLLNVRAHVRVLVSCIF